ARSTACGLGRPEPRCYASQGRSSRAARSPVPRRSRPLRRHRSVPSRGSEQIMRIVLFRHGPAGSRDGSRWADDRARALTGKGAARTAAAARGIRCLVGSVDRILTSPFTRALESAEIAREELEVTAALEPLDALAPGGSYRGVLARLARAES